MVPFPPFGLPLWGSFVYLALYLFFSPFLGCFFLIKFGMVSSPKIGREKRRQRR
jgi:hypothetical protein